MELKEAAQSPELILIHAHDHVIRAVGVKHRYETTQLLHRLMCRTIEDRWKAESLQATKEGKDE